MFFYLSQRQFKSQEHLAHTPKRTLTEYIEPWAFSVLTGSHGIIYCIMRGPFNDTSNVSTPFTPQIYISFFKFSPFLGLSIWVFTITFKICIIKPIINGFESCFVYTISLITVEKINATWRRIPTTPSKRRIEATKNPKNERSLSFCINGKISLINRGWKASIKSY